MIDGVTSQPFSATTLPPIEKPLVSFKEDIIKHSPDQPMLGREQLWKKLSKNGMNQAGLKKLAAAKVYQEAEMTGKICAKIGPRKMTDRHSISRIHNQKIRRPKK
jgi:hypothetical protein